ncbi:MAG: glycosyltransferase [Nanoarchaeota archaeon]|nr:glycosyltransferase [Nanoarchaeota archaeon]
MKLSIIIPALNEAKYIEASIQALLNQSVPRKNFEIIVVDNGSKDKTKEVSKKAGADKVVTEKQKGTNIARQRGVEESEGNILVFLDADCVPPPDWLQKIEKLLKQEDVAAVSGPYDYGFKGVKLLLEKFYEYVLMVHLDTTFYILFGRRAGQIMGGNFAAPRKTIEKIGGLPPLTFDGDDSTTAMMIARNVGKVLFTTQLEVKSSPRRFEKRGLLKVTARYAYFYIKSFFSVPGK